MVSSSHVVTPEMEARRVSGILLARYATLVNDEEVLQFRELLPTSRRDEWSFVHSRSVRHTAQTGWQPIKASHLLQLVQRPHACFIRSNDDLLDFITLRLRTFAAQPWNVGIKPLWNEPYGQAPSAKNEEELSNRLKLWLDAELRFIVNREVQPVELMEKRLDLKVEIPGEPKLCVIVEVKKVENVEVETSMQTQLVDTYLVAGRQSHGIYAVAWFGDKPSILKGGNLDGMRANLETLRTGLRKPDNVRVDCLLMDFRHPNPKPKLKKKRGPKSKT